MNHHSTLKLVYGYEPCYVKSKVEGYREFPSIFDVRVGDYGHLFKDKNATIHQKNDFWRHFSERVWSFDDFTFRYAPAAASLLTGALRYKIWYSPLQIYKMFLSSILLPYAPKDVELGFDSEENRGIGDLFRHAWFEEQYAFFKDNGKFFNVPKSVQEHEVVDHKFLLMLLECDEQGFWSEEAWKYHSNMLVNCKFYHTNIVCILQHEMLHIMWEHLTRIGDRNRFLHNIATDYAINQQLDFSPELKKVLITDHNETFFTRFVTGIAMWRSRQSTKDLKTLEKLGLTPVDSPDKFAKRTKQLAEAFVYERQQSAFNSLFGFCKSKFQQVNQYNGKDSDFYYEVLEFVKDDMKENGQGGTLDDHSMWEKNDDEQKDERGEVDEKGTGDEGESGQSGESDSDSQENGEDGGKPSNSEGKGDGDGDSDTDSQSSPKKKGKGNGKGKSETGQDSDDGEDESQGKSNDSSGPKVSTAKKSVEQSDDQQDGQKQDGKSEENGQRKSRSPDNHVAEDGDGISFGGEERSNMRGGYEHPGFRNMIGRQEAKNAFRAAATAAGYDPDDPADLERALNDIPGLAPLRHMFHEWFSVKTKNWRKELRAFLRHCVNPTELEYTMLREHRALDDTFPGKKRDIGFNLILALDTSGSIGVTDFNDFMGQVHKMSKDCDFDKVRIIQCHSRISDDRSHKVRSARKLKEFTIVETGGTKMQPVFERLKREGNKLPLVLFTDGHIDRFEASRYSGFKHIMFLSRGHSGQKSYLESMGFKVLCQDDEPLAA